MQACILLIVRALAATIGVWWSEAKQPDRDFSKHDIAVLFVGGFGASMLFGTFIGAAADKLGRKRLCLVYCVLYLLSCMTKHARDYNMLMMGRVLGGIATSLLFSSFESRARAESRAARKAGGMSSETRPRTTSILCVR